MADSGIKKTRILQSTLPAIDSTAEGFVLRYRIVSQDKNRLSHWSQIQVVKPEYTFEVGDIHTSKSGNVATIVWDAVKINKVVDVDTTNFIKVETDYDVWIRWDKQDSGDWIYKQRISGTSVSFPIPATYYKNGVDQLSAPNRLSIEIYAKGSPIVRGDGTPFATGTKFLKVYQYLNYTI